MAPKETPRQKMIGMMYLFYTALLALNVSKDVLDAFVLVDQGLSQTTENFVDENNMIYQEFNKAYAARPSKVGPWKMKADQVFKRSNEICDYMQSLKVEIIKTSDKKSPAVSGKKIDLNLINRKDDTDAPSQIMVGDHNQGKANNLKADINKYRDFLISFIDKKDVEVIKTIKKSLNTSDPPVTKEGTIKTWQTENFEHLPLVAVMTILSRMQIDVRNAESTAIKYLLGQIDAGAFTFNKLDATVIANSNFILKGNQYSAQVFIAAQDTSQKPEVFVGAYDSIRLPDGTWDYRMRGSYTSLPIKNGKGIYQRPATAVGMQHWGGIVRIKNPDGTYTSKPFKQSYQIGEAGLTVSPTKMNVFYVAVDNPVSISVPGVPAEKVYPSVSNGVIKKRGNSYIVNVFKPGTAVVSVQAEVDGKKRPMGSMLFRVKTVPDPVAKIAGSRGGNISKNMLIAQAGVEAEMENFDFDLNFTVTQFTVSTTKGGFVSDATAHGFRFTEQQRSIIHGLSRGQKVYFEDIRAVGPDGSTRKLGSISFKID